MQRKLGFRIFFGSDFKTRMVRVQGRRLECMTGLHCRTRRRRLSTPPLRHGAQGTHHGKKSRLGFRIDPNRSNTDCAALSIVLAGSSSPPSAMDIDLLASDRRLAESAPDPAAPGAA